MEGRKVLEMGCGDCVNAAVMAALGAEVYANDIADSSSRIVEALNEAYKFETPIRFVSGDFLENNLESESFDFVVGKAFLHHLELPVEEKFLKETARLLNKDGEARFFEPAVNSKLLDELRWISLKVSGLQNFRKKLLINGKGMIRIPIEALVRLILKRQGRRSFRKWRSIP